MRPMWDGAAGTLEERGPGLRFPRPKNKTNQVRRAKKEWSMRDGAAGALEEREPGLRFPRPIARRVKSMVANGKNGNEI